MVRLSPLMKALALSSAQSKKKVVLAQRLAKALAPGGEIAMAARRQPAVSPSRTEPSSCYCLPLNLADPPQSVVLQLEHNAP